MKLLEGAGRFDIKGQNYAAGAAQKMKKKLEKGRLYAVVIVAATVLVCLNFGRRCSTTESTLADDYVKPSDDTIAVAIEMSPLTYTFCHDTAEGFDYSILKEIGRRHDVRFSFRPVSDLDRAFAGLNDGQYDLVVASFPATSALKEYFPLTDAVYIDRQVLVQRRGADSVPPTRTLQQLRGDTVWISAGSPFRTRLQNLAAEMGDSLTVIPTPEYSAEQLVVLTALGKIPRAVVNENVARLTARDYPDIDYSVPVSLSQFQVWAAAPGDSVLVDSLDRWLDEFQTTATYDSLYNRYLK